MKAKYLIPVLFIALLCSAADAAYINVDITRINPASGATSFSVGGQLFDSYGQMDFTLRQQADAAKRYEWLKRWFALSYTIKPTEKYQLEFGCQMGPSEGYSFSIYTIDGKPRDVIRSVKIITEIFAPTLDAAIDKAIVEKILEKVEAEATKGGK